VFVTSPTDGVHFQRLGGTVRILLAPNGVDLEYFRARTADSFRSAADPVQGQLLL